MKRSLLMVGFGWVVAASLIQPACAQPASAPDLSISSDTPAVKPLTRYTEPEPSIIPVSWQLDIKVLKVDRKVIPGLKGDIYYWYIIYTVSNPSSKTLDLMPRVTMLTDTLDLYDAQLAINPDVFKQIKDASRSEKVSRGGVGQYLEEPLNVNRVLGGADNAQDTVAVFALKGDPKWFRVFFCGFSGEQATMKAPSDNATQVQDVTMEKVRVMEFAVPGNTPPDGHPPVELRPGTDKWTMRAMPPQRKYGIDLSRVEKGLPAVYEMDSSGKPKDQPKTPPINIQPTPVPPPPAPKEAPAPKVEPAPEPIVPMPAPAPKATTKPDVEYEK